jgi:hypothetical protein
MVNPAARVSAQMAGTESGALRLCRSFNVRKPLGLAVTYGFEEA